MQYKFAKEQLDYSDFSSGRVFYSLPGHPAFPVRLASEIFQRCVAHREAIYHVSTPCTLYDPCSGAAYQLSVLGYVHGEQIREIIASDIDERAVTYAGQNLGLLSMVGLEARIGEITDMLQRYGKQSHEDALQSALRLKEKLSARRYATETRAFQANAADAEQISKHIKPNTVDLVFTDVPYGLHSSWKGGPSNPIDSMLETLLGIVSSSSILAIASDKHQKARHPQFQRIERFQVGKRRVMILRPL